MPSSRSAEPVRQQPPAIISPAVDLLLVGGLSVLVFVPLLLSGRTDLVFIGAGAQAWLATLINMPHFMASYRIVYRSREMILRHKWASIYVPAILLVYTAIALWEAQRSPVLVVILVTVGSAYLAWHYTGQVWGMMASYAWLGGTSFDRTERLLIRTGLRILLAWHVAWFFYTQLANPSARALAETAYTVLSTATVIALVLGAVGIARVRKRTGRMPPPHAIVAWLAIFVWYAMMARDPKAIFWIQIAHAIQYLAFPVRVEINRAVAGPGGAPGRAVRHLTLYAVGLLAVSYLVAQVVPGAAMSTVAGIFGDEPGNVAPVLILMFINIHHYFTDGVIWKISNPEVRKELFAHVKRPAEAKPAVVAPPDASPVGTGAGKRKRKTARR